MEREVLQSLEDVGYGGQLLDASKLNQALQGGAKSPEFTKLVSWLTDQIGFFNKIDDTVHPTTSPADSNSFLLELSTFLKELGCANSKLTTSNVNQKLANVEERCLLLDYLIGELMAGKILEAKKPKDNKLEIKVSESITARNMREMLSALRFQKPPDNISADLLFKKLHAKVSEVIKQVPKELIGKPIFFGELNNEQWGKLDKVHGDLNDEFIIRREMLLKRLDVTVNSFTWSERIKPRVNEINKCFHAKRDVMLRNPDVTIANLLAARDDLAIIEKTSSASVRKNTRSAINKVMIGAVPDRGGRPTEQEPPPPEMPPWQKDRVQGPQRGGFSAGGRGGGDRGGGRGGGGDRGGRGRGDRGGRGGGGDRGGRGGGADRGGGGGGYRDNKSATSNFGQNLDSGYKPFANFDTQLSGYAGMPTSSYVSKGYSNQGSSYGGSSNQGSGYTGSNYSNQSYGNNHSSNYSNQGSSYGNQSSGFSNQGGYDRKSGGSGDYKDNRDNKGQGRGGRVQGGWNQGGGQGGRRY